MSKLIISPAEEANVSGVNSGLDSMGRGNAEPIEGHAVVLSFSKEEVSANSTGGFATGAFDTRQDRK